MQLMILLPQINQCPNIGKIFNRDHSTIMSSIDMVEKKINSDNIFSLEIEELTKQITEN